MKNRFAVASSSLVLAFALSACGGGGGGGVNSTPPPPAPTPTPTPTPTPPPTPMPTPPPTGVNGDLIAPLESETFRNIASVGTLSVPTSGANVTANAGPATLTFAYNASSQAYTVSDGTRSQTFTQANIDPAQTNGDLTTYKVVSGNTTDFLSLTTSGTTAGKTRYVGAGFWQRQVNGATAIDGRFLSFTYGAQTPDAALPRTGAASFDVRLLGARSFSNEVYSLSGTGRLSADLQSGAMFAIGRFGETVVRTGQVIATDSGWNAVALIASGSNSFAGRITFDNYGTGDLRGAFYGPAAEEVGGAYYLNPNSEMAMSGTLFGARGTYAVNQANNLNTPQKDIFFRPLSASLRGAQNGGVMTSVVSGSPLVSVLKRENGGGTIFYSADGRIPTSSLRGEYFTNSQYLRVGLQRQTEGNNTFFDAFAYGFDTAASAVPRTGSASFNVSFLGGVGAAGSALNSVSGIGSLTANFATGALTTLGNYTVSSALPLREFGDPLGSQIDAGSWTGTATIAAATNAFSGNFAMDGTKDYSGTLAGKFFGPAAEEVGAAVNTTASDGSILVGALYGARGADVGASQTKLLDLTTTTVLNGMSGQYYIRPNLSPREASGNDSNIEVTYDPVAGSYIFQTKSTGNLSGIPLSITVQKADRVAADSDARFDVYQGSDYRGRIYKPGPGNPEIALSYASFADLSETGIDQGGQATTARHFALFGGRTPSFQIPTTGNASYSGIVYGAGRHGNIIPDAQLTGTSKFNINFATGVSSLVMSLIASNQAGTLTSNLGNFTYASSGTPPCPGACPNQISLSLAPGSGGSGFLNGYFFGPNAAEYGASFVLNLNSSTGQAGDSSTFAGVTLGRKD